MRVLTTERHWQKLTTFERQFRHAASELAEQQDEPQLKGLAVSPRQFERWYSGKVKTEPYPDACRVLEHMFGYPVQQLLALTTQAVPEALSSASIDLIAKPSLFGPSNSSSNLQEIEPQRQEMNDALSEGTMIEGKPASAARNRTTRCRNCRLARAASRASGAGHTQGSGTADSHQSEAICRKRHKNALPSIVKAGTIRVMTDDERLRQMIDELRRMREQCEPKSNQNPRYLRYSNAVSALRWIIEDLAKERARNKRT